MRSPRRNRSAEKKKSTNPFEKMFAKKNGNNVINFRNVASSGIGSKKGSLFTRISTRYEVVNKRDDLLKYEDQNNKDLGE